MDSILDRLLNFYSNTNYRSSSNCCNKQITQPAREDKLGCLEEVFTILLVSICSLSNCMPPETHIIKYVKNYIS